MTATQPSTVKLFCSYAHADVALKRDLVRRLTPRLRLSEAARFLWFDDSLLETGERWDPALADRVVEADYGVLFLSMDFFASDYITRHELPRFVGPDAVRGALPVALKRVPFQGFNLHGVAAHQIFTLEGKAYSELRSSADKDEFATRLVEAIASRLAADGGRSPWRPL